MFRKPKRKAKGSLRRKDDDDEGATSINNHTDDAGTNKDEEGEQAEGSTTELLQEARKRIKQQGKDDANAKKEAEKSLLHTFDTGGETTGKHKADDLATSTAMHHPTGDKDGPPAAAAGRGGDGVYRQGRNKFWAGPIKAASNVRVTSLFDYQPDICKDYKETGFCGFGDTCIYLHDRGDSLAGWQLEEKWQEEKRLEKEKQEKELNDFLEKASTGKPSSSSTSDNNNTAISDDGLPFACHLCRTAFTDPVVTTCLHYFCEECILNHVRNESDACPICHKETHRVFNEPTKLLAKKRQLLGAREAKQEGSWQKFFDAASNNK